MKPSLICRKDRDRTLLVLLGIIFLGIALRLYSLTSKILWYDEISTISIAAKSFRFILRPFSSYKLLFIILLKAWIEIFGISAVATRILPALFGIASIFLTFRIGKDLFNARIGLIASFLLSISCFHIYQSRQVKHHALLLFLILLSLFCLIRFLSERKTKFVIANGLVNTAIIFTHPFGFYLIVIQVLHVIFTRRLIGKAGFKKWVFFQVPLLFAFGVWVGIILRAEKHLQALLWWVQRPDMHSLVETFKTLCYGLDYGLNDITLSSYPAFIVGTISVLFGLFFIRGILVIFRYYFQSHTKLLILWLFLPVALTFIFSHIIFPVYVIKHLLISLPAFYFIVAIGLWHKTRTIFIIAILFFFFLLNITPLKIMYDAYAGVDWRGAVQLMKAHSLRDNDIIIMATTKEVVCLIYYLSDADKEALGQIDIFGKLTDGGWQESFQYRKHYIITLGSELPGMKDAHYYPSRHIYDDFARQVLRSNVLETNKRIWLLISKWSGYEYKRSRIPQSLRTHFKMTVKEKVRGVRVFCFEHPSG